jgi:hypothetical protein
MNPAIASTAIIIRHGSPIVPVIGGDQNHARSHGHSATVGQNERAVHKLASPSSPTEFLARSRRAMSESATFKRLSREQRP